MPQLLSSLNLTTFFRYSNQTPLYLQVFKCLRLQLIPGFRLSCTVSITLFSVRRPGMKTERYFHHSVLIRFHLPYSDIFFASFWARSVDVVVVFSNASVFTFRSLHFKKHFQISPFSIVLKGNGMPKQRHSISFAYENGVFEM